MGIQAAPLTSGRSEVIFICNVAYLTFGVNVHVAIQDTCIKYIFFKNHIMLILNCLS